jgi:hypothetical protein
MGSPKTRAKAPKTVQYTPAPVETDTGPSAEEQAAAAQKEREQNLLRRSRGTIGTVLNGFRGLLAPLDASGERKSLLGE